jgi:hypothetical protein
MKQAKSGSYQPRLAMIFSLLTILLSGVTIQAQASNPFADCANGGGQDIDHTMYGQFDGMTCRPLMESIKSISIKPSNVIMSQKPTQIQISVVSTLSPSSEWMPQGVVAFFVHASDTSEFDGVDVSGCSLKSIDVSPPAIKQSEESGTSIYQITASYILPASCPSGKYSIATDMSWPLPQGDLVNNCGECGAGEVVFPTLELKTNQFTVLNNLNSKQKAAASNTVTATSKPATVTHSATKPTTSSRPSKATRGPLPCSAAVEQQLLNIVKYIQINADEDQTYQGELQQAQQNIGQDNATGNYLGAASDRQNVIAFQMKINANNAEDSIKRQQFATLTSQCVNTIVPAP